MRQRKHTLHQVRTNCLFALILALAAAPAPAALIAYEPFDYPLDAQFVGGTNGFGFDEPWRPGGFNARLFKLAKMKPGALAYPGLATKGANHLQIDAVPDGIAGIHGVARLLSTNLALPGAKFYLSFLHRPEGDAEYSSVVLGTGENSELSIGKSGSVRQYHISQRGGVGRVFSGVEPVVGKVVFLVVKLEFKNGPDRFTLYANPAPGKPEPATGAVKDDFDLEFAEGITLYSRGAWSVDELRLGHTWEDVTPAARSTDPK
jgi:hypothetical protein